MMKCTRLTILGLLWCCAGSLCALGAESDINPPGYAVASAHPLATNAGLAILAQGGNAFDAAVAVSAALAVVEPYHTGLGGGGFWLLHDAKNHTDVVIDGRETAPLAAHRAMFLDNNSQPIPSLSLNGGLAAAIPGEPAALVYIAKHFGKLPLKTSLAPAIELAEQGFPVDEQLRYFTTMGDRMAQMQHYPATAAVFLDNHAPYSLGATLKQPDLAKTLRFLAEKGHDGFYSGEVARQLVEGVRNAGGIWTLDDLKRYRIVVREPLKASYHHMQIITAPPPSAGGVSLVMMLNLLSGYALESMPQAQKLHYILEAMRLAYWARSLGMGDPAFVNNPTAMWLSEAFTQQLRSHISNDKATPSSRLPHAGDAPKPTSTSHFSILDAQGNRVSATVSINYIFGSSVVAKGTGVLLNDTMDDFSSKPGYSNVFGLVGSEANTIAPGKRPASSMTPSFLEMPQRVAILGTPGGSRIPTMVLLASLVFYDGQGAISMVSRMRFHHQFLPDRVQYEPETFTKAVTDELKTMGYHLMGLAQFYGDMQAITWEKDSHFLAAASDPRHMGLAFVVKTTHDEGYGVSH